MKKIVSLLIIIFLIAFTGCSNNDSEELEILANQLNELSNGMDEYEDLNSDIKDLSTRILKLESEITGSIDKNELDVLKNEIDEFSNRLTEVQLELEFVEYSHGLFKAADIEVGDFIAGMILVEKNYHKNWRLLFSGEVELTGYYTISEDDHYSGRDVIFFDVDDDNSRNVLPRALGDDRHFWFEVRNYDEAYEMLISKGLEGEATIVVDNYLIDLLKSDVVNEADLIKVIDSK